MSTAPVFTVESVELFERDVTLRMPFRFGVVTLTAAPQAFVRAHIRLADGTRAEGMAAELMAPKWFDKNPELSNEDNFEQLRQAMRIARGLYLDGQADSAFGHFERHYREQIEHGAKQGLNSLVANYGPALVDRALLDALCRALGQPFHEVIGANRTGIRVTPLTPDLKGYDLDAFLAGLRPAEHIAARHTVGLVDPITAADQSERVADGLPETLEEVVSTYGHRWFKLKVAGNVDADVARLLRIASVLDRIDGGYRSTLDGNEQYDSIDGALQLWQRMRTEPGLKRLCDSVIFIEQPIKRAAALAQDVGALSTQKPVILDESDDSLDAFVRGRERGYLGVSSKTCKGLYKSILNRARCAKWNAEAGAERYLMSAEDLTIQAGLALQQDLALVSLLGVTHVERNGHHYVNGMAALGQGEQQAFLEAHPDLYERSHGAVRLRIAGGELAIGSLHRGPGFASGASPDWQAMKAMSTC
jgi:L-alanine-DL-glutamate epimerase-like enolase superfamily enzyme